MIRRISAVVAGIAFAILLVFLLEMLGHSIYPIPSDLDFNDIDAMQQYIRQLPLGAYVMVMFAWLGGVLGGGLLACLIAREKSFLYSAIVGGFVLAGTIFNFVSLPHPVWFAVASIAAILATIAVTSRLGSHFVADQFE